MGNNSYLKNYRVEPFTSKKPMFGSGDSNLPVNKQAYLKKTKVVRTAPDQRRIDEKKAELMDLENKKKRYIEEQEQEWKKFNVMQDNSFPVKHKQFEITKTLSKLDNKKQQLLSELSQDYNSTLDMKLCKKTLENKNNHILETQNTNIDKSNEQIHNLNSDIMTKRRQVQINIYSTHNLQSKILIMRTVLMGILFSCLVFLLSTEGIGQWHFESTLTNDAPSNIYIYLVTFLFLSVTGVLMIYIRDKSINDLDWNIIDQSDTEPTFASTIGV